MGGRHAGLPDRFTAVRVCEPGGPPRLQSVAAGPLGPVEAVVHLSYAGVNPLDGQLRAATALSAAGLPRTLGVEGVGEVDGRWYAVYGAGLGISRDGTWAEYAIAPRDALVPVPDGLDLRLAAGAGVVGSTAVRVTCDLAQVTAADRVVVLGAGGGTGMAITSLARSLGAGVWGQVGSPAKADEVARNGAVPIVAASAAELRKQLIGLDSTVAFDALGGEYTSALVETLSPHGRLISYGSSANSRVSLSIRSLYRKNLTVHGYGAAGDSPAMLRAAVAAALDHLASGRMSFRIDRILPLAEADRALAALANREIVGKVLLDARG